MTAFVPRIPSIGTVKLGAWTTRYVVAPPNLATRYCGALTQFDNTLEAPEVWCELLGTSAEPGIFGEGLEAGFQSVTVTAGLFDTELFDGVIRDLVNVGGGTTG